MAARKGTGSLYFEAKGGTESCKILIGQGQENEFLSIVKLTGVCGMQTSSIFKLTKV